MLENNVYFSCEGRKIFLKNGTNQGDPLAPLLFNIYMEKFISVLRENCYFDWYKLYADDLVISVKKKYLKKVI
jgi:hypothetical protein